jgi:hypothetical protein
MRKCPKCHQWSMDFDDYFGRFRCLNWDCGWMAPSTTELELRVLKNRRKPQELESVHIPDLKLTLTPFYDADNDVMSIDFGLDEPTIDLPEPDGRMIWRIGRHSDRVAGFAIVGIKEGALSGIGIQFIRRRKQDIESKLPKYFAFARGRVTKDIIDEVIVTTIADKPQVAAADTQEEKAWSEMIGKLEKLASV